MYYYGARYYDPQLSRWVSSDPVLDQYFPELSDSDDESNNETIPKLPGIGGVYNSTNLNLYHYALNNPLKFQDPDGNAVTPETAWDVVSLTISIGQLGYAIKEGDNVDIALATGAVVFDAIAAAVPILPGGAGAILKATKTVADQSKDLTSASRSAYKEYKNSGGNKKSTAVAFASNYIFGKATKGALNKTGDKIAKLDTKKDLMSKAFKGVKAYSAPKTLKNITPASKVLTSKILKGKVADTAAQEARKNLK